MKTLYVAGFLFSAARTCVALVEKKKFPKGVDWSAHPLNAIGGHVEENEECYDAMVREFREETGVEIQGWEEFLKLEADHWIVVFYRAFSDELVNVRTEGAEEIVVRSVLTRERLMPNLHWILPLALDKDSVEAGAYVYSR